MKRNLFTTLILLSLPLLLLCTTTNSGIAQPLSRQEFKVQLLQAYTNDDLTRVRDLLKTQRLDAIRTIESVLDSSITKKARGLIETGNHDWKTANALADIYAQEFGDRFYLEKAHRYKKFSSESTKIKAQILVLRKTARDSLLQGKYDLARNFYEQALELAQNIDDLDDLAAIPGSIGAAYFYLGDFDAALENYQKSLTALEEIGDKWRTGNRLGNIANVYSDWSDYPTARAYFERALPYRKELDDKRGMAADYNNTGLIHQEMGNYEKALANYQHALELNRTLENQRSIARNLANIANIQIELGDYGDAIAIYGEALPIRRELGDRQGEGNDLGNLGLAYLSLGDYNKALSHFQQALAIHQELGYQEGEAYQLGRLADLYKFRGEYPEAIRNYQKALDIHHKMGHVRGEAYWIEALGQTYMAVGDHARALENFSNAIELHRSIENVSGQASTLSTIGRTYLEMNELEKAEDAFGQALKFHKDLGEKNNECMDLGNLGYVYSLEDEPVKAIDTWKLAMNLAQGIGNRRLQGWLQLQQGDFYRELDNGKKAARAYEQGLAISEGLEDPELRWQLYLGRGKLWQDRGDDERAFYSFQAAVTTVEKIRAQAEVEEFKAGILHISFETYEAIVTLLVRKNRVEEAFEYVERARSRALLDRLGNTKIDSHDPTTQNLIVQERELRIKIQNLRSQIVEEEDDNKGLRGSESSYRHSIEKAQMDYQRLLLDIKLRHPEYNSLVSIDPFPVSTIQRLLTNKSALLEYFITEESTIIFVVTQENLQVFTVPEGKQSVRGKIALYRGTGVRNMNKGKLAEQFWMTPLRRLYEILIAPVAKAGTLSGKEHLIIVPHNLLHYLPFQALITQEIDGSKQPHFLIEDYVISYAPSASALKFCLEKTTRQSNQQLLLAPQTSTLPLSETEVTEIANSLGSGAKFQLNESASESLVKQEGGNYDLLHFAATAHFNKSNPIFSRLDLAATEYDDGRLEVHEIFGLNLNANLVTLSACQTALGSGYTTALPQGDDFVSLTRAFLYAGTASVIASLWEVYDPSTSFFMQRFYRYLNNENKSKALAHVQRDMIQGKLSNSNYTHPYFWAPFILVGNWE